MTDGTNQRNTPSNMTIKSLLMKREFRGGALLLTIAAAFVLACDDAEFECEIGPHGSGCGAALVLHVARGLPGDPSSVAEAVARAEDLRGDAVIAVIHADLVERAPIIIDERIELRGADSQPLVLLLGGLHVAPAGELSLNRIQLQGEIDVDGGALEMINTMLLGHVSAAANAQLWIRSSTIVDPLGLAPVVACSGPVDGLIRNSVLIAAGPASDVWCESAMVLYSALEDATDHPGSVSLGEWQPSWFAGSDDLHLSDSAPRSLGEAGWRSSTDPEVDIDGEARGPDESPDYVGADVRTGRQK